MDQLKPHTDQLFNGTIWRMETDPITDTLVLEIRNEADKQVSFASIDLATGRINFADLTTDERWLTGIEAAYDGVLLLHHYLSAGSPVHKGVIAFDSCTGQQLWANHNSSFDHISIHGPVLFDSRIQPRKLFTADSHTGATLRSFDPSVDTDVQSKILLPDLLDTEMASAETWPQQPFGNIVHNLYYNRYRIVSLHALNGNGLNQYLYIFKDGQQVFSDLLNSGIQKLQPEAFVMHGRYLIWLKNKAELKVISLEN